MNKSLFKSIIAIVLSVALIATGVDLPFLSSVVRADETVSWTDFQQMINNAACIMIP